VLGLGLYLDQGHFPLHTITSSQIIQLDDVNQFVELFLDLFSNGIVPPCNQGYAGNKGVQGLCHTEALYIETTTTEQACHPRKDSRLIVHQQRYGMFLHKSSPF